MKPGYSGLISLVSGATELPFADCFTLTLLSGTVLRYTNFDVPVTIGSNVFVANAVRIQGLKFKQTVGVDIDEQEIDLIYSETDTLDGEPVAAALRAHVLDLCEIQRDRAFFDPVAAWPPNPSTGAVATGSVMLFKGRVADIQNIGRTTAQVNVKSDLVLLDIDFPRNLWQTSCLHTLYDSGCGLTKSNYQTAGSVGAGSTNSTVLLANGGSGATFEVTMSGAAGAPLSRVVLTSSAAVNAGYASAPSVTVSDPTGTGAVVRALWFPFIGLYGFVVVSVGANYTNPVLEVSTGTGGTASGQVLLAPGTLSVASVVPLSGGANYTANTQIQLSGGGGNGAAFVPIISGGVITGTTRVSGGSGFYAAPTAAAVDVPFQNYSQGMIQFTSGDNSGVLAQIKSATSTELFLLNPLESVPAAGDTFLLSLGCDHSLGAGGCAKFNNQANFRGFPYVPPPDTAY